MAITSSFANLATVTRASKKTDAGGWDFTSGGVVGALTEYAAGAASLHPTAGVLIEKVSTTNQIRNPRCEGAVAGTPGTLPTNWGSTAFSTTISAVGSGSNNGWPYFDVRFAGTPTAGPIIYFETQTAVSASTAEDWTLSVGIEVVAGDTSNITGGFLTINERTAANVFIKNNDGSNFTIDTEHRRFFYSVETSGGTTGYVYPFFNLNWDGSGAIDITIRFYAPQIEQKSYPTSPVFPVASSPAASTRAADVISVANGSWENDGANSFFATVVPVQSYTGALVSFGADANNRVSVEFSGSEELSAAVIDGGATQWSAATTDAALSLATAFSFALGADTNSGALSVSGATQILDTSMTLPTLASGVMFGQRPGGGGLAAGFYLQDFRYFPRRLSNAELEALVGN
jgi:hypothetical protein